MKWTVVGISLVIVACGASEQESDGDGAADEGPAFLHVLRLPAEFEVAELSPKEIRWRSSLVRNLGHTGEVLTYMRSGVPLLERGTVRDGLVFRRLDRAEQYLVDTDSRVIVDFERKEIGTAGVDGITFHPHPEGRMIVVLLPHGVDVLGVTLSSAKAGDVPHEFSGGTARWTW